MNKFLAGIQKTLKFRVPRHIGVILLCTVIGTTLSSTVFIYNAFAFFNMNTMVYNNISTVDTQTAMKEYGIIPALGEHINEGAFAQQVLADNSLQGSFAIHIHVDNKTIETISAGETVDNIITRSGILLESPDEVSPGLTTLVTSETDITILRIKNYTEEVLEPIPFETIRKPSEKLSAGESVVVQKGVDGQQKALMEIYSRDGKETLRYALKTTVVTQPVSEIIEYGKGGVVTVSAGQTYAYKQVFNVTASAYTTENSKRKLTASGTTARVGAIAVDPDVIPMGTKMLITSADGKSWVYGVAVAEDTGGSIKGNKVDLYFNTRAECMQFGIKKAKVYILE